jgi:mRNA interferase RelE/StbE
MTIVCQEVEQAFRPAYRAVLPNGLQPLRYPQPPILSFLLDRLQPASNPRQWGKPLHGDKGGLWRYRVEDYRLICDIQDETITVLVLRVGHRKNVYRLRVAG